MTIEKQLLAHCLKRDFYQEVNDIIGKEMFANGVGTIFDTIAFAHVKYNSDITVEELVNLHRDKFPAMPDSSRDMIEEVIRDLKNYTGNSELAKDLVTNFWRRNQAHEIGSKATDIWLGHNGDYAGLQSLVDNLVDKQPTDDSNFVRVDDNVSQYLESCDKGFDFQFQLPSLKERISGVGRGNLGIIFARPETGKTTFCTYLVSEYIKQGFKVAYFANEEPGRMVKGRIFCSYLNKTVNELRESVNSADEVYNNEIKPKLSLLEGRQISISEIDKFVEANKPDIIFVDQLDKVSINDTYARVDEKLRAIYETSRAIAKRRNCMVWAVSQASYEAHNRQEIDFGMLENSRTGKAAEADIIIGIGKNFGDEEDYIRHLCVSKNKLTGWHGVVTCRIDIRKARYIP